MKFEMLDTMTDGDLRTVIDRAGELLKSRDRQRKDQALEDARAILAAAGLSLKELAGKSPSGTRAKPAYRGGYRYQHPAKPELIWNAKGQKPNWLRQLEKSGQRAVELPPETAQAKADTARA